MYGRQNTEIVPGYLSYARGVGGHSPGWHRIAKIKGKFTEYSCVISVKRIWNRSAPEYQKIQFLSAYSARKFISLEAISASHIWTKIRETYDETEDCSYMEIYQNASSENWWLIIIENAIGAYEGSDWKAIPPELTQETLSGVTVLASLDLPANNPD
ncbi:hypothetical protein E5329_17860 [Petralouisia muris]|uniref:Uncharacterized protein n=1 Tax=Petralouisia muris TaxID=3032872 RepID=A0AC61RSK0_9FIRM|nr:hypothetical protein [Petralouisia muris]TGY93622.1 hypothetical protein E5329_17860 [Petralouisia muris]